MRKLFITSFLLVSNFCLATDYTDAVITGVGVTPNDNFIRFTVDKAPNAIFLTKKYTDKQHDYVVSLILASHASKAKVAFIRSEVSDGTDTSVKHYVALSILEVGSITHD